jgi:hypothetical protein
VEFAVGEQAGDEAHDGEVEEGAGHVRKARAKLISGWCRAVMAGAAAPRALGRAGRTAWPTAQAYRSRLAIVTAGQQSSRQGSRRYRR